MQFGLNLRDFSSDPSRPINAQLDETAQVVREATSLGFWGAYIAQHWVSHPTVWLQPLLVLARLAPENPDLRLITGILLLPLFNPVDIAEQTVTLDHITSGRFILGLGLGYRDKELEAVGTTRAERVVRFEESITLMKRLWSGEDVTFEGDHWRLTEGRLGLTPLQKPHPPIWIACQSHGATRRAATMGDGCLVGPQVRWEDLRGLSETYWAAQRQLGSSSPGSFGAHRYIAIAADRETAMREAREAAEAGAAMYSGWDMQESTMLDLQLSDLEDVADRAIVGSPEDCAEILKRYQEETGMGYVGLTILNLPREHSARLDFLRFISDEFLGKLD